MFRRPEMTQPNPPQTVHMTGPPMCGRSMTDLRGSVLNADYIAYYLDPRNFLNETDIFQFESLSFSKVQTRQGVSSILKGTFMENMVEDSDGSALDYAQAFMDIGEETGVSPYHLASRVRQEQGLKGTSSLISGTYSGYKGYYNYFNVGAAGITSTLVIKNGLAYAKKSGMEYPVCST